MRHVFIINPAAGQKNRVKELLEELKAVFPEGGYEAFETTEPGDARRLAARTVEEAAGEPLRIYACGGDGTLNEVVNGAAGWDNVAVTNVPLGTGNDFLRIFGMEGRAKFADIAALKDGPQSRMDLIDCNGMLGIDVVCAGVDARVADEVDKYKRIPLVGKKLAYILALVVTVLFKGITRPMRIHMGPHEQDGPTAILCVCNGQYYGGGFRPMPEAVPDDGMLDMLIVGDVNLPWFARYVGKYSAGRYKEIPEKFVRSWRGNEVTASSDKEMVAVVDGESLRAKTITIKLSDKKINFFRPVGVELETQEQVQV